MNTLVTFSEGFLKHQAIWKKRIWVFLTDSKRVFWGVMSWVGFFCGMSSAENAFGLGTLVHLGLAVFGFVVWWLSSNHGGVKGNSTFPFAMVYSKLAAIPHKCPETKRGGGPRLPDMLPRLWNHIFKREQLYRWLGCRSRDANSPAVTNR